MSGHDVLHGCLWFISSLWVLEQLVRMSRVKAPKRNRRLGPPSPLCERTGQFEVRMGDVSMFKHQAD